MKRTYILAGLVAALLIASAVVALNRPTKFADRWPHQPVQNTALENALHNRALEILHSVQAKDDEYRCVGGDCETFNCAAAKKTSTADTTCK